VPVGRALTLRRAGLLNSEHQREPDKRLAKRYDIITPTANECLAAPTNTWFASIFRFDRR
jgi:hypothetical protein